MSLPSILRWMGKTVCTYTVQRQKRRRVSRLKTAHPVSWRCHGTIEWKANNCSHTYHSRVFVAGIFTSTYTYTCSLVYMWETMMISHDRAVTTEETERWATKSVYLSWIELKCHLTLGKWRTMSSVSRGNETLLYIEISSGYIVVCVCACVTTPIFYLRRVKVRNYDHYWQTGFVIGKKITHA